MAALKNFGGSSTDCLVGKPDANLLCSVCLGLFDAPHRTRCGHVFCGGCIRGWLAEQPACPACRAPVDPDELAPDRLAGALVDNLPSHCSLQGSGCTWVGTHGELNGHLASTCPCVMLRCQGCEEELPRSALAEHSLTCTGAAPRECPYGCGERIVGGERMAQHKAQCLMEPRKLLAALGHLQRENERLASENTALRSGSSTPAEPGAIPATFATPPGNKKRRARGPGECVE